MPKHSRETSPFVVRKRNKIGESTVVTHLNENAPSRAPANWVVERRLSTTRVAGASLVPSTVHSHLSELLRYDLLLVSNRRENDELCSLSATMFCDDNYSRFPKSSGYIEGFDARPWRVKHSAYSGCYFQLFLVQFWVFSLDSNFPIESSLSTIPIPLSV